MPKEKKLEQPTKSKISLMVATPCYDTVQLHYCKSILDLQKECILNGYQVTFQILKSSLVTQGRNLAVSAFLNSSCTHFLFIDSDISFSTRSIFRLLHSDHEISCIAYPMKTINQNKFREDLKRRPDDDVETMGLTFPIHVKDPDNIKIKDGWIELHRAPAGCMMIQRSVFTKLVKEYPKLTIKQDHVIDGKMVRRPNFYNFFDTYYNQEEETYLGEDFYFCKLWTDVGGKIHALVDEYITHTGEKSYIGKLKDELTVA